MPGQTGVVAGGEPLQFAELVHQDRALVHLGQRGSGGGVVTRDGVRAGCRGQISHTGHEAVALGRERAEARVEHDVVEAAVQLVEPARHVAVVAERSVLQAGVEHALVTAHDDVGMGGVAVGHREEDGHERPVGGAHRHVALVALHGRHQHACRKPQVLGRDGPRDDAGPLDEVHDLLDLPGGVAPRATRRVGGGVETLGDGRTAFHVVGDHGHPAQVVAVRTRRGHVNGPAEEPVALAGAGGRDAGHLEHAGLVARLRRDPAHRAREAQPSAVAPAHGLAEAQPLEHPARQFGHEVGERCVFAGLVNPHEVAAALGIGAGDQGSDIHALPAREALGRLGGGAVLAVCGLDGRAAHGLGLARLAIGHAGGEHGDTPGRHPCNHLARGQMQGAQGVGHEPGGLRDGLAAGAGGQILAADLDEHVRHQRPPANWRPAMPRRTVPQAHARARCRHPAQ